MAHAQINGRNNKANVNASAVGDTDVKPTTFHDFLGNKGQGQESAPTAVGASRPPLEVSPSATSDLGSERRVSSHLEGIPFYGSRGDITGPESSNRLTGSKRSNSDSFMMSSKDKLPPGLADSQDNHVLTKLMRYSGGERPRRPNDEEASFGLHQMRPISASFVSQLSTGVRNDTNHSKWDRTTALNPNPVSQYPPRMGQVMPFGYQGPSNRFKETNVGPTLVSQTAADEGSRTGIKGSGGVLSSINATGAMRQPAGVLIRSGKQKSGVSISEPESSTTPSHRGMDSGGRQMTIFYGGQAHVFDNVHPNKADVIMAMAGSNGGSWSTTYTPKKSTAKPSTGENRAPTSDNDGSIAVLKELQGRPSDKGDFNRGFGSAD